MNKIFTFLAITVAFTFSAKNLKAQLDLADTLVYPDANAPLYENVDFTAYAQILNAGAVYPKDSALTLTFTLNGSTVSTFGPLNFTNDFQAGGTSQLIPVTIAGSNLFGLTAHTAKFCAIVTAQGDNNQTNDSSCVNLTVLPTPNLDFGVTDLSVFVDGNELKAGDEIQIGSAIDSAKVEITNFTTAMFAIGFPLRYQFNLGDSTTVFNATTNGFLANGTTTRVIANPIAFDGLPTTAGNYEICATTLVTNDANNANDGNCGTSSEYKFVSPTSITEIGIQAELNVNTFGNKLHINQNELNYTNLQLINMEGKVVLNQKIALNNQINVANLSAGVYMVFATGNNNGDFIQKIMIGQ